MCGIFGYIGPRDPVKICLEGLKYLEYRGYDSAGIAGLYQGQIRFCKEQGKILSLEKKLAEKPLQVDLAIAHTRWATHGKPSQENAHPQFDQKMEVAVVHNGIIENHDSLREMLKSKGILFQSETDTEVIAQLIAYLYRGNFLTAVQEALQALEGLWGIAVIHKNHPGEIIACSHESPIVIGINQKTKEAFVSSDVNAFQDPKLDVLFLQSREVAVITQEATYIYDQNGQAVQRPFEHLGIENVVVSKNGFAHFMLKEIAEQPFTIQQALNHRLIEEAGSVEFEDLHFAPQELSSVERILILGCGTSWHAGCIAATLLEDRARIPAHAEIASEFRHKNPILSANTLVIAISQSGETLDTLAAVREVKDKGAKVLGICNVRHSTLTREADSCVFLNAGPEISVCSTKAFTSQLTVLALFTLLMGRLRHVSKQEGKAFIQELQKLPQKVEQVLAQKEAIHELARKYAQYHTFFFLGRHYMYPTSLEGALKLKEISYLHAMGYPAGEMKHGPIALIDENLPVIGMCGNQQTYDKMLGNLMEVKARGAPILALAFKGAKEIHKIADDVLWLPPTSDELASIPFSVATQLLAYYIALEKGTEIDQPRNLAKSVTVE